MGLKALGIEGVDISTQENAAKSIGSMVKENWILNYDYDCSTDEEKADPTNYISRLDNAIEYALDQATMMGAYASRLDFTANNLTIAHENATSAQSTIMDADMAQEMTTYTKNNILLQASQSMLAQANQNSSNVLSLLQ